MTKKPRVYISGAIEHHDYDERYALFDHFERYLSMKGFRVFNPMKNGLPRDSHWRAHMRVDIAQLLDCDYIYMLKGWELSKGCKLELDVASSCGIPVLYEGQPLEEIAKKGGGSVEKSDRFLPSAFGIDEEFCTFY